MATSLPLPPLPATLKSVGHQLKTAAEHEKRDPVVTYWCRLSALQAAMKLDKKSKEAVAVLVPIMDWLEKEKKALADNEAVSSEVVASAHIENYAMKLFSWADQQDRASNFNKNVVKSFYTAGVLFDVMLVFGELTPENQQARKYAKWKAAYIHNCLKNGETPQPGPQGGPEEEDEDGQAGAVGGQPPAAPTDGASGWDVSQIPDASSVQPQQPEMPFAPPANPTPAAAPALAPVPAPAAVPAASGSGQAPLKQEQVTKAQRYCKFASSALDYDDRATAIDNLTKALRLLQTGSE